MPPKATLASLKKELEATSDTPSPAKKATATQSGNRSDAITTLEKRIVALEVRLERMEETAVEAARQAALEATGEAQQAVQTAARTAQEAAREVAKVASRAAATPAPAPAPMATVPARPMPPAVSPHELLVRMMFAPALFMGMLQMNPNRQRRS